MIKDLSNQMFSNWKTSNLWERKRTPSNQIKIHWYCTCICGKQKWVYANSLTSGKSKSCGCTMTHKRDFGAAALTSLYSSYRSKCKRKKWEFNLTEDQFKNITKQNCYYCDKEPSNNHKQKKFNGNYIYNGIDRIDNNKGYNLNNVVACCKNCNKAKLDLSTQDFFQMIKKIYERNKLNEIK